MTLADAVSARRGNNLDPLRLIAALSVVVSHAWPLALGMGAAEPLQDLTGRSLGGWAVVLFFFLSGFLIIQSAERRSTAAFWSARARRILPGLAVALLVSLGLAMVSGATPNAMEAARYVLRGLSLAGLEHQLTGAYAANPYPHVVNGPLWSLQHEVAAYVVCFAAVRLRLLRSVIGTLVFLAASVGLVILAPMLPGKLATFAPLFLAFALGMAAWRLRDFVPMNPLYLIVSLAAAVLAKGTVTGDILATLAFCHAVLLAAYRLPALELKEDISYGVYIYGWPVAQMLITLLPGITPFELAVLSIVCTLPIARASWLLVERPALPLRPKAA
jgi:peptidoglycan/LPS O-acetylase OafA/YrhL